MIKNRSLKYAFCLLASLLSGCSSSGDGVLGGGVGSAVGGSVGASRMFGGPNSYPPEEFRAYGIIAFPSKAREFTKLRHLMICEAYTASLPTWVQLGIPRSTQMVTVWPVASSEDAAFLQATQEMTDNEFVCSEAVKRYGLVTAQQAIMDAEIAGLRLSGRGPFLLAWSPASTKGNQDALVLALDLSDVETFRSAEDVMIRWRTRIQQDRSLWDGDEGWSLERIRLEIRSWADTYGRKILIFGES